MGLDIPINLEAIEASTLAAPTKTPRIDFENGRFFGYCDGIKAIEQYIKVTLLTPRFRFLIYDNQYGSEIDRLIESNFDDDLFQSEAKRCVKEALCDERITEVYDFDFTTYKDDEIIRFSVDTVFGPLHGMEVKLNV